MSRTRRRHIAGFDQLEERRLLVGFATPTVFQYVDGDGDIVTVALSKPVLSPANIDAVFRFPAPINFVPQSLARLNLDVLATDGLSVTITAKKVGQGDGLAPVGAIVSEGFRVGRITVNGDVGRLECGAGIGRVTVDSFGALGTTTQFSVEAESLVELRGSVGPVTVKKDVTGMEVALASGSGDLGVARLTVGGSLIDSRVVTGSGLPTTVVTVKGDIDESLLRVQSGRAVSVGGSVKGGSKSFTGLLLSSVTQSVTIGGSVIGGSASGAAAVETTGFVNVGSAKRVVIGGSIIGGDAGGASSLQSSGTVAGTLIGSLTVRGSVIAGNDNTLGNYSRSGLVSVRGVRRMVVGGSITGNTSNPAIVLATGGDVESGQDALGVLVVGGSVERAVIQAGDAVGGVRNADARIGTVTVAGSWTASSLTAGAASTNAFFGDVDDAKISGPAVIDNPAVQSRIRSLTIRGQAFGSANQGDSFGVVAEEVTSVKVAGVKVLIEAGPINDEVAIGGLGDFRVRELS